MAAASGLRSLSFRSETSADDRERWKEEQPARRRLFHDDNRYFHSQQFMMGLTIAGVATCLLVTTFGLFHVDVFLRVYNLPLETYSRGNVVYAVVNTFNDFLGAWLMDSLASRSVNRSDLIGISGSLLALCFLIPFGRSRESSWWDGIHFISSMCLYDTMCSFMTILLSSLVTDNHSMTDRERVRFMASGQTVNLVATFGVARIGLEVFDEEDMSSFRRFLWVLAVLVTGLYLLAQMMTANAIDRTTFSIRRVIRPPAAANRSTRRPRLVQVVRDFWSHGNFWAWIGMELFLESQVSFVNSFLKTFVDRLLLDSGEVSKDTCDLLLSIVRPLGLIAGILCYIPIERFGYRQLYSTLFAINASLCIYMLLYCTYRSTFQIMIFLLIYPAITVAVGSAGFHLVMSDMVLERKRQHATEGRIDEPSLAAIYLGINNLFCKPAESFLPVIAANMLSDLNIHSEGDERVQSVLYKVLVIPPLIFSFLQWLSWRRYTLTRNKTRQMREALQGLPELQLNAPPHRHVS